MNKKSRSAKSRLAKTRAKRWLLNHIRCSGNLIATDTVFYSCLSLNAFDHFKNWNETSNTRKCLSALRNSYILTLGVEYNITDQYKSLGLDFNLSENSPLALESKKQHRLMLIAMFHALFSEGDVHCFDEIIDLYKSKCFKERKVRRVYN